MTARRLLRWRPALLAWVLLALVAACAHRGLRAPASAGTRLPNGLYAVLAVADNAAAPEMRVAGAAQSSSGQTLVYDPRVADPASTDTPSRVTVDRADFVPLVLESAPEGTAQPDGRLLLGISLAQRYVQTLAEFTRAHLGGRVAIVISGDVVTMHKIRSVITGGKMQITRCTDRACEQLRTRLLEGN